MDNINIKILENTEFEEEFLDMKLTDMYCKHMIIRNINNDSKMNRLLSASDKIGYEFCEWGMHDGYPSDLYHHINIITKMEKDNYKHSVRIVICKYDFCSKPIIWVDNLHSTVKYIREYGKEVKLKDIPFYVVDLTDLKNPIVKGYNNSLRKNISDILGTVSNAYFRYDMSNSKELIDVEYLVKDLINDNIELYTYHNTHLGPIEETDSIITKIEKSQAFNSLWDLSNV